MNVISSGVQQKSLQRDLYQAWRKAWPITENRNTKKSLHVEVSQFSNIVIGCRLGVASTTDGAIGWTTKVAIF
jgi:hypothetical protein